jgi:hypothetical protein
LFFLNSSFAAAMIKMTLLLLVMALLLPLWLKGPDGKPIMDIGDWTTLPAEIAGKASALVDKLELPALLPTGDAAPAPAAAPAGQYYRWQDAEGQWHFADKPPQQPQPTLVAEKLPEVQNSLGNTQVPEPSAPVATGTEPAMGSSITPSLPAGVSREAIEKQLQDGHEQRMGEHL